MNVRIFVSLLSVLLVLALIFTLPTVAAMGDPSSSCPNLYATTMTTFVLVYPGGSLNVLTEQNASIQVPASLGYNVTFVLHTAAQNTNGNTNLGTAWYSTDAVGYEDGACLSADGYPYNLGHMADVGPNQNIRVTGFYGEPGTLHGAPLPQTQLVFFSAYGQTSLPGAQFLVSWVPGTADPDQHSDQYVDFDIHLYCDDDLRECIDSHEHERLYGLYDPDSDLDTHAERLHDRSHEYPREQRHVQRHFHRDERRHR